MRTSAELDCPPSLMETRAMCECSSMIPAVRCLPAPSMTRALGAEMFLAMRVILPFSTNTSVPCKTPASSLVQTVVFLTRSVSVLGFSGFPKPTKGNKGFPTLGVGFCAESRRASATLSGSVRVAAHLMVSPLAFSPVPLKPVP